MGGDGAKLLDHALNLSAGNGFSVSPRMWYSKYYVHSGYRSAFTEPAYPFVLSLVIRFALGADKIDSLRDTEGFAAQKYLTELLFLKYANLFLYLLTLLISYFTLVYMARSYSWAFVGTVAIAGLDWSKWISLFTPEVLVAPLAVIVSLLFYQMKKRPTFWVAFSLGASLSCLTLSKAAFQFLWPLTFLMVWKGGVRESMKARWTSTFGIVFGLLLLLPWLARNHELFGGFYIRDKSGYSLWERADYSQASRREWRASFWAWMPLSSANREAYRLLGLEPTTVGAASLIHTPHMVRVQRRLDELNRHLGSLRAADIELGREAVNFLLTNPLGYIRSAIHLCYRGVFVDGFWISLILFALSGASIVTMIKQGDERVFFMVPSLYVVAMHATFTVNGPRYNFPLVACLCISSILLVQKVSAELFPFLEKRMSWLRGRGSSTMIGSEI